MLWENTLVPDGYHSSQMQPIIEVHVQSYQIVSNKVTKKQYIYIYIYHLLILIPLKLSSTFFKLNGLIFNCSGTKEVS